jgi:hypothetical protein
MFRQWKCISFGTACGTIIFVVALVHLFPVAWAGGIGQCSVSLSLWLFVINSVLAHFVNLPFC